MSPKKNDKLIGVINDEAFKNKHEENLNGSIKEPRIHGKLTHILGESEEATKSLAFFSIVLSFGCLLLISLFFFITYWCSSSNMGESGFSNLFQSIKGIVECFSPIITLIIGYCLGEKASKK